MIFFPLDRDDLESLVPHHRAFQAAVAKLANRMLGFRNVPLKGAGSRIGGVTAGGKEIDVYRCGVHGRGQRMPTREEIAVASAIVTINYRFQTRGEDALPKRVVFDGPPLRRMFKGFTLS